MINGLLFLATLAFGQDSFDSHGFDPSPSNETQTEVWDSTKEKTGDFQSGVLVDYSQDTLEIRSIEEGVESVNPIVQELMTAHLLTRYAISDRVSFAASVPVILGFDGTPGGRIAALGDVSLYAPVFLGGHALSFTAVPFLGVPGLGASRFATDEGMTGGALLASSFNRRGWVMSSNVGVHLKPAIEYSSLRGGPRGLISLALGRDLGRYVHVRGEIVADPTLRKTTVSDPTFTEFPVESNAAIRIGGKNGPSAVLGGSTAITRGVSAAKFRVFAGFQWAWPAKVEEPVVCPEFPECDPPGLAMINFDVVDEDGKRVSIPFKATDGVRYLETTTDKLVIPLEFPPGYFSITITVPNSESTTDPDLVRIEGDKILLLEPIYFDFDEATIRFPESRAVLVALAHMLKEHSEIVSLEVGGHTDERGSSSYNLELSERRMKSVVDFLVAQGISRNRLVPVGYGENELKIQGCDKLEGGTMTEEECHQLNRRVEFTILERQTE
ncbi:MAG: OmpA family protein [Candidatus Thorarchaeota archaeon]|jgi:outer membrane protein OmpA-like peptidoglycan-associated protein